MESGTLLQDTLAQAMIEAGAMFHRRGWVPATGGNFSARLSSERVLITASGVHKGELKRSDFLVADMDGRPLEAGRKSSYETGLHMQIYRSHPSVGAVLHVHTIANTVLSRRLDRIVLTGYELLKLLPGAPDPESRVEVPVFGNDQDIARLSARVDAHMREEMEVPAYLIAGHGLYAWGDNVAQARHRVEALEFMFECELWSGRLSNE
ncbi:MAG TPA: methylthioribulose 1-phosphate dehydratase [Nevskia sp.]|nr:methylthioribulose 1-phosphate dehydratase [Nevskia sp.]